jgi:hypothetical protein
MGCYEPWTVVARFGTTCVASQWDGAPGAYLPAGLYSLLDRSVSVIYAEVCGEGIEIREVLLTRLEGPRGASFRIC